MMMRLYPKPQKDEMVAQSLPLKNVDEFVNISTKLSRLQFNF